MREPRDPWGGHQPKCEKLTRLAANRYATTAGIRTALLVGRSGVVFNCDLLAWIVWDNVRGIARTWAAWAAV
jgi:hypothetical protein